MDWKAKWKAKWKSEAMFHYYYVQVGCGVVRKNFGRET